MRRSSFVSSVVVVRQCREHKVRVRENKSGDMVCPVGWHQVGDDEFEAVEQPERDAMALAWAAGVFDARGSCHKSSYQARKNGRRYVRVTVRFESKERGMLEWIMRTLQSAAGLGSIWIHRAKRDDLRNIRERYRLSYQNGPAVRLLATLRPYLRVKARQVDALLSGQVKGAA